VGAELSRDRQPARQRASKAMGQHCTQSLSRSARILLVQQGREHASWYRADGSRRVAGQFD
jgi:hypothetical protein